MKVYRWRSIAMMAVAGVANGAMGLFLGTALFDPVPDWWWLATMAFEGAAFGRLAAAVIPNPFNPPEEA